jgi:hypothetical protein
VNDRSSNILETLGTLTLFVVGVSPNTLNVHESTNVDAGPWKHTAIFSSTKPHKGVVPTTEELTQHFTRCKNPSRKFLTLWAKMCTLLPNDWMDSFMYQWMSTIFNVAVPLTMFVSI